MKIYTTDSTIKNPSSDLLGGKGFGLWEMSSLGLPVPPALIIPPSVCREYMANPEAVMAEVNTKVVDRLFDFMQKKFGYMPLLSVRSGAKVSMPGMMDTVLNVGIDDNTIDFYRDKYGDATIEDSYARLIEMYSDVVLGTPRSEFEGLDSDSRRKKYWTLNKADFPSADLQLSTAIEAVFKSWNNPRAKAYRDMHGIPHTMGTAVIIQAMVFGNAGDDSCTGVVFSRNPSTGATGLYGEFMVNAQGEDIVAGIRTPDPISAMASWDYDLYCELIDKVYTMENHRRDMQDVEFTVENGKLWILQTRNGKRTAEAALRIGIDFLNEGKRTLADLREIVKMKDFLNATKSRLAANCPEETGVGIPASNGIAIGTAVFSSEAAEKATGPVILIANETTPDDIKGMAAAEGILTTTGGATSHAAVVARGMNKPAVVGLTGMSLTDSTATIGGSTISEGDLLTIDGATGRVWFGAALPIEDGADLPVAMELLGRLDSGVEYFLAANPEDVRAGVVFIPATFMSEEDIIATLKAAAKVTKSIVVDLRSRIDAAGEYDAMTLTMYGDMASDAGVLKSKAAAVLQACTDLGPDFKVQVIYDPGQTYASMFDGPQFTRMPTAETLDELLMAEGLLVDLGETALHPETKAKIIDLKSKAGEPLEFVKLGQDATTPKQKLQSVLG